MSRLAGAAATLPSAASSSSTAAAATEDESLLTVAEKGLKRVYDLLREQVGFGLVRWVGGCPAFLHWSLTDPHNAPT